MLFTSVFLAVPSLRQFGSVATLLLSASLFADDGDRVLNWTEATKAPVVDGKIGVDEYPVAARGTDFVWAFDGTPSPFPAEFWLTSDSKHIYFAIRVKKDPGQVRADQFRPNASLSGDDTSTLFLDGTGVGDGGDSFTINASSGNSLRLFGGTAAKVEWAGTFDSQGRKTETGWESECRIPWAIVSNRKPGSSPIKFAVSFYDPKQDRRYTWQFQGSQPRTRPVWQGVSVPLIEDRQTLSVLPYITSSAERDRPFGFNTGLDFKARTPKGMTYVGTINPDLRNIENDVLSLGFSYFERLAGEARPFFLEGRNFLPRGTIFTSQRIRDFDFAVKAFGQPNKWDRTGFMRIEDFGKQAVTAFSYGRRTKDQADFSVQYVGNEEPGRHNEVWQTGFDKTWGPHSAGFGYARSYDQTDGIGETFGGSYNYYTPVFYGGFYGNVVTSQFQSRLGFINLRNIRETGMYMGYQREFKKGSLLSWAANMSSNKTFLGDGTRKADGEGFYLNAVTRNQLGIGFGANRGFFRSDDETGTARFFDNSVSTGLNYPANDPFRNVGFSRSIGRQGGVTQISNDLSWSFRPLNRLTGSVSWSEFTRETTEHQTIGSVAWDIGKFETVSTRFVNQQDNWNVYFSYRKSGFRGNEFFVIVGDPNSLSFTPRIALKFVAPVSIRF